jgi:hypothetical protein
MIAACTRNVYKIHGLSRKFEPHDSRPLSALHRSLESRCKARPQDLPQATPVEFDIRMGTRIRFLGWYRPGIGHPLFSRPPFHESNVIGHAKGPGPASLKSGYGSRHRSIEKGDPFGRPGGRSRGAGSGFGMAHANAAVGSHLAEFSEQERRRPGISRSQISSGDSRHIEKGTSLAWVCGAHLR